MAKGRTRCFKVVTRKLGREKALGQAFAGENFLEIDSRLRSRRRLTIMIHEMIHLEFPDIPETKVDRASIVMANTLWKDGYRKLAK